MRPPQRRPKGEANGNEQQGIEIGQQLQAHRGSTNGLNGKRLNLLRLYYKVMTESVDSDEKMAL